MRGFVLSTLLLLLHFTAQTQTTISVLWLGNSYTGTNDLPQITRSVAQSVGNDIVYQSYTPGGYRFLHHAADGTTQNLMAAQAWDYVTLQAQSQEPSWPDAQVQSQVFPYAQQLCDSIRVHNGCAKPVFYMTWGRENGDASNCGVWPPVCTYTGMDSILYQNYRIMGEQNKALVSPVGAVWKQIRALQPTIDLYVADESHPTQAGSYAAAVTFHTIFFGSDPGLITYDYSLSSTDANAIKSIVKTVVYDSLAKWNINRFEPVSYQTIKGCDAWQHDTLSITQDTSFSDTLKGMSQFGCDSIVHFTIQMDTSHAVHHDTAVEAGTLVINGQSIESSGQYTDSLLSAHGCDSVVVWHVNILNGISELLEIKMAPNPFNSRCTIHSTFNMSTICLSAPDGTEVYRTSAQGQVHTLELHALPSGMYYYSIAAPDGQWYVGKLVKQHP